MSSTPNSTVEASTTSSSPASCMASNNNAPKYGTRVPNRVFVGGLSGDTTEAEMETLFSNYGQVSSAKIISDRAGVSKGYGFITFETEEQARNLLKMSEVYLKNRKLNIAPAIKKQSPYGRSYEVPSPNVPSGSVYYSSAGVPYTIQNNGMSYYPAAMVAAQQEAYNAAAASYAASQPQPQAASGYAGYPYIYPAATQAVYTPQQYSYQTIPPPALPDPNATVMFTSSPTPPTSCISSPIRSPSMQLQSQQQQLVMSDTVTYAVHQQQPHVMISDGTGYTVNMPMTMMTGSSSDVAIMENNSAEDTNALNNVEEPQQVPYNMGQLILDPGSFSSPPPTIPTTYLYPVVPSYHSDLVHLSPSICSILPTPIWSPYVPPPFIPELQNVNYQNYGHYHRRGRGGNRSGRGRNRQPKIDCRGDYQPPREHKPRRELPPRMYNPQQLKQQDYTPNTAEQVTFLAIDSMCNNNNNNNGFVPPDLLKMVQDLQVSN